MVLSASTLSGLRSSQGGSAPGVPGGGAWISLYVPHFMEPLSHEPSNLWVQRPGNQGSMGTGQVTGTRKLQGGA